jgi:2-iminobutanoate/2-iminopropanoate deaminase
MAEVKWLPTPYSYSMAVAVGNFVFLSGHLFFGDGFPDQLDGTYPSLVKTLAEFNLTPADIVKAHISLKDIEDFPKFIKCVPGYFKKDNYPIITTGSSQLLDEKMIGLMDGIAYSKEAKMKTIKHLPTPFSYSAAVAAGDYVFLGLHRGFGTNFTEQFHDIFKSLKKTLAEFDLKLDSIVKVNVWLKNISDIQVYEKLFNDYFEKDKFPARMGATTEFIDKDCLLMIDGIAYRGGK